MSLDQTVGFLNKTEGRDKLGKLMQYGSRFLMDYLKNSDPESSEKFKAMFSKKPTLTFRKHVCR